MTSFNFSLLTGDTGPLVKGGVPDELRIPISFHSPIVGVGDQVLAGTKIATANPEGLGDLHSPLAGTVTEIHPYAMVIEVTGEERAEPEKLPTSGSSRKNWLRESGFDVRRFVHATTLIINAVPPEPGISIYDPLLRDYRKTLETGLDVVQQIVRPIKMFLAVAKGNKANAFANCTVVHVPPVYPNGIDQLVIKAVTGKETLLGATPDDTLILSVKDLFFIGRTVETGRPRTETVMTIGTQNHLVHIGTPVGFLAMNAGTTVQRGDKIILGGMMRGLAAANLEQGVDKDSTGLQILRPESTYIPTDNFCLGCGECERHCPARIMPGMISRCAEFKQFNRAETFHIHSCIECGICGYWCKAQRPLLQYIRLAKYELALLHPACPPETTKTAPEADNA